VSWRREWPALGAEVLAVLWVVGVLGYYYWSTGYLQLAAHLLGWHP